MESYFLAVGYSHKLLIDTETPLQKNNNNSNNNKDKEITIPYYTTQDSLVLPMLNQSICDRRFTSN